MAPDIQRVNSYDDPRFSQKVLCQHGAFLVNGEPYEVEILNRDSAVIRGTRPELYRGVVEDFRFFAGHISRFYNSTGELVQEFAPVELFSVKLDDIQPSQFYVDEEKLAAVRQFVRGGGCCHPCYAGRRAVYFPGWPHPSGCGGRAGIRQGICLCSGC